MDLPLREIIFNEDDQGFGVFAMSTVKNPAIKRNFVYFNEQQKVRFSLQEEKKIVFAPALIPNQKVYRNIDGEEFYLTVSKETIQKIAVDFVKNNRMNNVNVEHQDNLINGVTMFQALVTDEHTVPSVKGFEDLPIGTWFIGAKINNDEILNGIKEGKFNGWSIHAMFQSRDVKLSNQLDDNTLRVMLNKILYNI
jgi:hypothetical protein